MGNSFPQISVAAIVFDALSRVLLIQRGQPPAEGLWSIPGGKVRYGESLPNACKREVKEETGIDIEPGPLVEVIERITEGFHYVILDYSAHTIGETEQHPVAASDVIDARWVELSEIDHYDTTEGLLPVIEKAFKLVTKIKPG